NGETVAGQHRITALEGAGIRAVWLEPAARANPRVLESVASADAIVLGPGSFYTSVLPHLLVPGIAAALGASRAPKILVGNMLECSETVGLSLNHMIEELCRHGCPTHVLANRSPLPLQRSVGGRRYIAFDEGDALLRQRAVQVLSEDFEDPWQRGVHDPGLVAAAIARLSGG
ncbi:MAG TPA: 2-phospho-L-lactate transferase CofD family protein, partial [Burkholderiales bacterium]